MRINLVEFYRCWKNTIFFHTLAVSLLVLLCTDYITQITPILLASYSPCSCWYAFFFPRGFFSSWDLTYLAGSGFETNRACHGFNAPMSAISGHTANNHISAYTELKRFSSDVTLSNTYVVFFVWLTPFPPFYCDRWIRSYLQYYSSEPRWRQLWRRTQQQSWRNTKIFFWSGGDHKPRRAIIISWLHPYWWLHISSRTWYG